ncbi:MAG TPA: glycosyltransferase family A protein [Pyrinomonadaceae bacterium]|jgi:glycosyltransferase involved in cell wall biosynthesis
MLNDLQTGWGNEGYAARTDFLQEVAKKAVTTVGPILECGSGLTTILFGLLAGRRGVKTYSLEHISEWRTRVNQTLQRFQLPKTLVYLCPLREYDGFDWYDPPLATLPKEFDLVICDGPPGETRGGRYGLLPVLGERLPPGAVILLDDTERAGEAEVLHRWAAQFNIKISQRQTLTGSFAVITRERTFASTDATRSRLKELDDSDSLPPLTSIVIPAYNVAPYIGETLDSVFAQTFTDYEVILVNDGSSDTDELERALEPYAGRLRYLTQENAGASVARNQGLRAARGEFIAFLDADDLWRPNYLEEQLKFLREHKCDLVCADAMIFGDSPDAGRTYMEWLMDAAPPAGEVTFLDLVRGERSLITSGIVARRKLILEVGLFDEALRNAQDFDLWLRLARHGARLAYHRRLLLRYRCRQNSLTGDATNSIAREFRVFDKIEQSYNLTAAERAEVSPVIRDRRAALQFELGKLLLAQGELERARAAFASASNLGRSWKMMAALWFSRLAPSLMQSLYLRRMQNASAR